MLETERLLLIPVTLDIVDTLLASNDLFCARYGYKNNGGEYLNPSPDYLNKIRKRLVEHPEEYPLAVDYLIVVKEINTVIGTIYFKSFPVNGASEIGYGMSPQYEGKGYMSEALNAMLLYGKNNGINTVLADTKIDNIKSQNVLKRNGFIVDKIENGTMYFIKQNNSFKQYNIVAGEELKKILNNVLDNPIPFNEDMSKGDYHSDPFSEDFINERCSAHHVDPSLYKNKLHLLLETLDVLTPNDEIDLYFGEDEVCLANRKFLIEYFTNKVKAIRLHVVDEYTGKEIKLIKY